MDMCDYKAKMCDCDMIRVGKNHDLKKSKKSDFFDLNQIFFLFESDFFIFIFFCIFVHCCCIKQFKLHCDLHVAQN